MLVNALPNLNVAWLLSGPMQRIPYRRARPANLHDNDAGELKGIVVI